jgi:hypothetical protein
LKEWSGSFALHYCQEFQWYGAPVLLETGPRVTQDLPLVVTTAWVALDFNTSGQGRWSGDGTLELGILGFGLVIRPGATVVGKAKGVWS